MEPGADSTSQLATRSPDREESACCPRLRFIPFLLVLAFTATSRPAAACDEPFSRCVSLETALPSTAPSRFLSLHSFHDATSSDDGRLLMRADYHRRPFLVVAASPDPFGREVPVLNDWLTAHLGGDLVLLERLRIGMFLPLSARLGGTGSRGITSQSNDRHSALGVGDPELFSSFAFAWGRAHAGVVQRLALPFGTAESWLSQAAPRYAPSVAASLDFADTTLALEVGARFRKRQTFGDTSFGSEAFLALGASQELMARLRVGLEGFVLPSLAQDESSARSGQTVRLRRIPAEWVVHLSYAERTRRHSLGIGGSLPLTRRIAQGGEETFAGPPGAVLRLTFQVEQDL